MEKSVKCLKSKLLIKTHIHNTLHINCHILKESIYFSRFYSCLFWVFSMWTISVCGSKHSMNFWLGSLVVITAAAMFRTMALFCLHPHWHSTKLIDYFANMFLAEWEEYGMSGCHRTTSNSTLCIRGPQSCCCCCCCVASFLVVVCNKTGKVNALYTPDWFHHRM